LKEIIKVRIKLQDMQSEESSTKSLRNLLPNPLSLSKDSILQDHKSQKSLTAKFQQKYIGKILIEAIIITEHEVLCHGCHLAYQSKSIPNLLRRVNMLNFIPESPIKNGERDRADAWTIK